MTTKDRHPYDIACDEMQAALQQSVSHAETLRILQEFILTAEAQDEHGTLVRRLRERAQPWLRHPSPATLELVVPTMGGRGGDIKGLLANAHLGAEWVEQLIVEEAAHEAAVAANDRARGEDNSWAPLRRQPTQLATHLTIAAGVGQLQLSGGAIATLTASAAATAGESRETLRLLRTLRAQAGAPTMSDAVLMEVGRSVGVQSAEYEEEVRRWRVGRSGRGPSLHLAESDALDAAYCSPTLTVERWRALIEHTPSPRSVARRARQAYNEPGYGELLGDPVTAPQLLAMAEGLVGEVQQMDQRVLLYALILWGRGAVQQQAIEALDASGEGVLLRFLSDERSAGALSAIPAPRLASLLATAPADVREVLVRRLHQRRAMGPAR